MMTKFARYDVSTYYIVDTFISLTLTQRPNVEAEWLAFTFCMWEVAVSNLVPKLANNNLVFPTFLPYMREHSGIIR
jgi:hypothetical protein